MEQVRYSNIEVSTVEETCNDSEHENVKDPRASDPVRTFQIGRNVLILAAIGAVLLVGGLGASTFAHKGSHALRLSASSVVNLESSNDKDRWDIVGSLGAQGYDIRQGRIGTCYVLASFVALAKAQPQIIANAFVNKEKWDDAVPVYETRWNVGGFPMTVSLDNYAPANDAGFFFVGLPDGKRVEEHLWPVLLEKAAAKIQGSYFSIAGGLSFEILRGLAMAPTSALFFSSKDKDGNIQPYNMSACSAMWDVLTYSTRHNYPVTWGVTARTVDGKPDGERATFVPGGHEYAFLGTEVVVSKDGVEQKVARVYNPWGTVDYTGQLPLDKGEGTAGEFRMLFDEEFCHDADSIGVATVYSESHQMTSQPIELKHYPAGSGAARRFKFKLEVDQQFNIAVQWVSQRMRRERFGCQSFVDVAVMVVCPPKGECVSRNNFNTLDADADDEDGDDDAANVGASYIQLFMDGISKDQAVAGEYEVFIFYATNTKADQIALTFYALDKVKPEEIPVNLTQVQAGDDNICSKRKSCTDVVQGLMKVVDKKPDGEVCDTTDLHNLPDVLGNSDQIQKDGKDKYFPHAMESLTKDPKAPGACGGDAAHGQGDANCDIYNHWLPINEVVAKHFASVAA